MHHRHVEIVLLHRFVVSQRSDKMTGCGNVSTKAIAAMMEYTNHLTRLPVRPRQVLEPLVLLLSPFAPHLAEELWSALGHSGTLAYEAWPAYDDHAPRSGLRRHPAVGAGSPVAAA